MKYLAIDTTCASLRVILGADGKTYEYCEEGKKASEILLTAIDGLLGQAGLTLADTDVYAVVTGPGSFTGIRIGINTVKTFAAVTGKKIVAVNSIEKLAYNISAGATLGIVFAYANFCYVGVYDGNGNCISAPEMITFDEAKSRAASSEYEVYCDEAAYEKLQVGKKDDPSLSFRRAVEGALSRNASVDYRKIEPFYLIKSQAEREKGE